MHFVDFLILTSDFKIPWWKNLHMVDPLKWQCQQDVHRNSVPKDVLHGSPSFFYKLDVFGNSWNDGAWLECLPERSWEWCLGTTLALPLVFLAWAPWGALPLAILWGLFGHLGAPVGSLWGALGYLVASCGSSLLDVLSERMYRFLDTVVQNQASPDSPAVPGKVASGTAAPTPCPRVTGTRIMVV